MWAAAGLIDREGVRGANKGTTASRENEALLERKPMVSSYNNLNFEPNFFMLP